jgi:hypothetical protein
MTTRRTNRSDTKAKPVQFRKQGEVIRDLMLSAGQCATWLTLVPRACAVRECSALSRLERAELGELDRGSAAPLRQRTAAARYVSTEKIFQ